MKSRFAEKSQLIRALRGQTLLQGAQAGVEEIADSCTVKEYATGDLLIDQGGTDSSLLLILAGAADVLVNGRMVAHRTGGQHVGEMSLIDPSQSRIASVRATCTTVAALLPENHFLRIAGQHPAIWQSMALSLTQRLRDRERAQRAPNAVPHVFIGSSSEALPMAEALHRGLAEHGISIQLWTQQTFFASEYPMEALESALDKADFAVIISSPDDQVTCRGQTASMPRDNVLFEIGYFMGGLSRRRTLLIEANVNLKTPTDFKGITTLRYQPSGNPAQEAAAICAAIRERIECLKVR